MRWTYKEAGVDLAGAASWIQIIRRHTSAIQHPNVVGGLGGFAGLYRISEGLLLAACADGVGTKIEVARLANSYESLGVDLVAMNVNDLITCGASPLFFLDYIACGSLDTARLEPIFKGIVQACKKINCALLGGETAEMPDIYETGGIDLAGFAVGAVGEKQLVTGEKIDQGDKIIGLRSSGIHSNGFSLVRKVLLGSRHSEALDEFVPQFGEKLSTALLCPTRLYVKQALEVHEKIPVSGMAHITGGGLEENILRVLPKGLSCSLDFDAWTRPEIFNYIASRGVSEKEMRKVFNLGIGFVFILPAERSDEACRILEKTGEEPVLIGEVTK
ncbi:MAG: phosphoribosylformylglycinamidine cyclo-ligase [Thermovirgaceae bacterium]